MGKRGAKRGMPNNHLDLLSLSDRELEALAEQRAEATADALLQNALMEETTAYLQRGRTHKATLTEDVQRRWLDAFRRWFRDRDADSQTAMDDLAAEIGLRNLEPDYSSVRPELDAMVAEIREAGPHGSGSDRVLRKISEFRESLDKPKN